MALLQHKIDIVGKRRKGGKAAAEARDEKHIHRRRHKTTLLGQRQKESYKKTAHHIYYKGSPRKGSNRKGVAHLARKKTQAGTHKSAQARKKHHFQHTFLFLGYIVRGYSITTFKFSATSHGPHAPHWHSFCLSKGITKTILIMHLTPKELDKLTLLSLGMIAERRLKKGLKLNHPEAVAYITSAAIEGAREGLTVEQVMSQAAKLLTRKDVMEGVADMIQLLQVEAVFTDGSRLVSIHHPIK